MSEADLCFVVAAVSFGCGFLFGALIVLISGSDDE
jgi:hypothetical protein